MHAARFLLLAVIAATFASGCASMAHPLTLPEPIRHATGMADAQVAASYIRTPRPERFSLCHEHTCHEITEINLPAEEWTVIRREFSSVAPDAAMEREQIKVAISHLERIVGNHAGTGGDRGRNFPGLGLSGQMDCVDEATNTSVYLLMLQQDGLLRWHQAGTRRSRGVLQMETLHFTATITEKATRARYAVDSWFEANGQPPHIVPLRDWINGWEPRLAATMGAENSHGTIPASQ